MKWNHNSNKKWEDSFKWHKWYAWRPVSDGNTWYWGELVMRRRIAYWYEWFWEYKAIN